MNICEEIRSARACGVVRCGLSVGGVSVIRLAGEFGLSTEASCYHEIPADTARVAARCVLTQDLAYGAALIEPAAADALLERFFATFGAREVRYFTNAHFNAMPRCCMSGWNPATSATFDTGVLVIGPHASGVLWVEDED